MRRFYLDTEFNEHQGCLISIALVADTGEEFYYEVPLTEPWKPWVSLHVKPKLTGPTVNYGLLRYKLHDFLGTDTAEIICDWPTDISHVCALLDKGNGERFGPAIIMFTLLGGLADTAPENPHHALSDARALRKLIQGT